jgi:hypothetical protein
MMDTNHLSIYAGFFMIGAATALALWQKTMSWQHVIVFCLGGVLTGIPGLHLNAQGDSVTLDVGQKLAAATDSVGEANAKQADALASLGKQVDQLQTAVAALQSARVAAAAAAPAAAPGPAPVALPSVQQHSEFLGLLSKSRAANTAAMRATMSVKGALAKQ